MIELINAARAVQAVRPSNWNDGDDPEAEAAWSALERALEKAETRPPGVANPVQAWLQACCLTGEACGPTDRELAVDLHGSYLTWCARNGIDHLLNISQFGTALSCNKVEFKGKNNRSQRYRGPVRLRLAGHLDQARQ